MEASSATALPGTLIDDVVAHPEKYDESNLSPIQLVKHLAVYGPRDPSFLGLKCPGTHYRTTKGFMVNLFSKQGVHRDHDIEDAFVLKFYNDNDRFNCTWSSSDAQVEVMRVTGSPITIVMDTITDSV